MYTPCPTLPLRCDVVREFFTAECQRKGRRVQTCNTRSFDVAMREAISLYRNKPEMLNARQMRLRDAYERFNKKYREDMRNRVRELVELPLLYHSDEF